jgi:Fe-Mn family superoxide dismutase
VKLELPPLPYAKSALAPHLSARTVDAHYEKHHKGYLRKLTKLVRGKPEEKLSHEELVRRSRGEVFENAAQVWNHNFYWRSMRPAGGDRLESPLRDLLVSSFGSVAGFKQRFAEAANGQFGSGWAWLVKDTQGRLRIQRSPNAENPLQQDCVPLLTLDVWEHAYYLDYQNERERYVRGFLDHLLNWKSLAENLEGAQVLQSRVPSGAATGVRSRISFSRARNVLRGASRRTNRR